MLLRSRKLTFWHRKEQASIETKTREKSQHLLFPYTAKQINSQPTPYNCLQDSPVNEIHCCENDDESDRETMSPMEGWEEKYKVSRRKQVGLSFATRVIQLKMTERIRFSARKPLESNMAQKSANNGIVSLSLSGPSETGTKKRTSMYPCKSSIGFYLLFLNPARHSNSTYQVSSIGHVAAYLYKPANGMENAM